MMAKLEVELSAILNWAVEGYHRVLETGKFTRPASSDYLRESFQEQSSPIKSFIEDMCDVGGERQQPTGEIYKHWNIWRKVAGYKLAQTKSAFGKQLISADMRIKKIRGQKDGVRKQFYSGICLNPEKVQNFIIDSVGEKEWDKAKEEYSRQSDADIIDIFEWADKRGKDT
jgi:phage/plasmid-associated DNA primase